MNNKIPLTKSQREIMNEFYSIEPTQVIFDKTARSKIWNFAKKREPIPIEYNLQEKCPALQHQIFKSYEQGNNIQSAVFSECVYAQTLANMFGLTDFVIHSEELDFLPIEVVELLASYFLTPRYIYSNIDKSRMLVQAGGAAGIDSALFTIIDLNVYTIEFKEPGAKTSEPDLPKYGEDGKLITDKGFSERYPQFGDMLSQHLGVSMFDIMGRNIHDFSPESVNIAVSDNYVKKFADVCCTEDKKGVLTMIPCNQISVWADIEGEIRPAGRNHYAVWTPNSLRRFLIHKGAIIKDEIVCIKKSVLSLRRERGGNRKISGYKINPLFFVRIKNCKDLGEHISFNMASVRQLNPTIAGKVFFRKLSYNNVKNYYEFKN